MIPRISIYNNQLQFPVRIVDTGNVLVHLFGPGNFLPLRLSDQGWRIHGRSATIAREAIVRAWALYVHRNPNLVENLMAKAKARPKAAPPSYEFVVIPGGKLARLTKANYDKLLKAIAESKSEVPDLSEDSLKKFRPTVIGGEPLYLEVMTSAGAEILLNGGSREEFHNAVMAQHAIEEDEQAVEDAQDDWEKEDVA